MIICRKHKVIFLEIPKTGSMSLFEIISSSDFILGNNGERFGQHQRISHAIHQGKITREEARTWKIYAFIRNPFDRVMSAWNHDMQSNGKGIIINSETFDRGLGNGAFILSPILRHPQVEMLEGRTNITILLYENYEEELKRVFAEHEVEIPPISRVNVRRKGEYETSHLINMSEDIRRLVKHKYRKDFELWDKITLENKI